MALTLGEYVAEAANAVDYEKMLEAGYISRREYWIAKHGYDPFTIAQEIAHERERMNYVNYSVDPVTYETKARNP